jgi:hypothetical protein
MICTLHQLSFIFPFSSSLIYFPLFGRLFRRSDCPLGISYLLLDMHE